MTPLILMVAPNGARRTKADHPNLPVRPDELAREASLCAAAGATVLHLHVRDHKGEHSLDPAPYREAIAAVCGAVGERMVIQITTESAGRYGPDQQMALVRELRPEAVSLGVRELIPGDEATDEVADFLQWVRRERIAPQYILYSPADVTFFHALCRLGVVPQARPFSLFVLGRYLDPIEIHPRDVIPFLKAHDAECPWALCAFGPAECACVLTAAGLEGHVRVGFENNLRLADGRMAQSNADLVAQVRDAAPLLGRRIATIGETRAFLAETAA